MRKVIHFLGFILLLASCLGSTERPNIVLIFVDDMGYGDPSVSGSTLVGTPAIDRIANSGMTFTQGYVTSPVCGPSRVGLLSGAYQNRFGVYWNPDTPKTEIPKEQILLPRALRNAGYRTALFGKWNLMNDVNESFDEVHDMMFWGGDYWPDAEGNYIGVGSGWGDSKKQGVWGPEREGDEYLTDRLSRKACEFIKANHSEPFFVYLAYNAPHSPLHGRISDLEALSGIDSEPLQLYASMLISMDEGIGDVLDTIDACGIRDNTLLVFASDNGPAKGNFKGYKEEWPSILLGSTGGLRGHKGGFYEGGIRVPFFVSWPKVIAAGSQSEVPVTTLDLYPTFIELAGEAKGPATQLDGSSLVSLLRSGEADAPLQNRTFYWSSGKSAAVRDGDWKLTFNPWSKPELFNLALDPAESENLRWKEPAVFDRLMTSYEDWIGAMPPAIGDSN